MIQCTLPWTHRIAFINVCQANNKGASIAARPQIVGQYTLKTGSGPKRKTVTMQNQSDKLEERNMWKRPEGKLFPKFTQETGQRQT